jgi:hypothetical protein
MRRTPFNARPILVKQVEFTPKSSELQVFSFGGHGSQMMPRHFSDFDSSTAFMTA